MSMHSKQGLVETTTTDGLILQGFLSEGKNSTAFLFIHGYAGNFYENAFVRKLIDEASLQEQTFLTGNTRGAEYIKDFNTISGELKMIGARYELLEEAYVDIDAWIKLLLDKGYEDIVLMGHSLGTMKVTRYMVEGTFTRQIKHLVLLAPFDKKGEIETRAGSNQLPLFLAGSQQRIDEGYGQEQVQADFDVIDICHRTFLSWYSQDELGRVFEFSSPKYDFPILHKIQMPVTVIVGSNDEYFYPTNPDHPEEAIGILEKHISEVDTHLLPGIDHGLNGAEDEVARIVLRIEI